MLEITNDNDNAKIQLPVTQVIAISGRVKTGFRLSVSGLKRDIGTVYGSLFDFYRLVFRWT
jgi:hypothetical protein